MSWPTSFYSLCSALFDVVEKHLPTVHCYADDSQLYFLFSPKAHSGQTDAVAYVESCIQDSRRWMYQDKLLMTDAKTKLLFIDTRQQHAKVTIDAITIGNSVIVIAPQSHARNLGDHITKTNSAALYFLYNIRKIRKYLSKECTKTLIHTLISSRLDYCNNLFYGLPASVRFRNCKESSTLLRALYSKKVNFVILHHR